MIITSEDKYTYKYVYIYIYMNIYTIFIPIHDMYICIYAQTLNHINIHIMRARRRRRPSWMRRRC